jgi:hypothetical protein
MAYTCMKTGQGKDLLSKRDLPVLYPCFQDRRFAGIDMQLIVATNNFQDQ